MTLHLDGWPECDTTISDYKANIVQPMTKLQGIGEQRVPNHVGLNKFGHNSTVGATLEEVWDGSVTYPWQVAAEIMQVSSGDVDDQGALVSSGTATGGSTTTLIDTGANFVGDGVAVNDLLINDSTQEHAIITGVAAQTLTCLLGMADAFTASANAAGNSYRVANANDTGAAVTKWYGLDGNYNPISDYIIMATGADVPTVNSYLRVNRGKVILAGTSNTNEGDIIAENNASGVIWAQITAGRGQTLMALWTVPSGTRANLINFHASTSSNRVTEVNLVARKFGEAWQTKRILTLLSVPEDSPYFIPVTFSQRTDIAILASAAGGGGNVSSHFDLYYETI